MKETPKLKRAKQKGKITLYFDKDTDELYRIGKNNGWNTCEIVRRAATEALKERASELLTLADEDETDKAG